MSAEHQSQRAAKWKAMAITLAGAAVLGFTCCFSGLAARTPVETFVLLLGAVAWLVFLLQLVVAVVRLVLALVRK
jgi:hypothetical protein